MLAEVISFSNYGNWECT
uniref:Uncharacterized protein n=1 Tax=Anguilla anguilla TaxID=7936 RepID=A0A0E9QUX4_ANGAN